MNILEHFKQATAEANNLILKNDCVNFYIDTMQKSLDATQTFLDEFELIELHESAKYKAMKQV